MWKGHTTLLAAGADARLQDAIQRLAMVSNYRAWGWLGIFSVGAIVQTLEGTVTDKSWLSRLTLAILNDITLRLEGCPPLMAAPYVFHLRKIKPIVVSTSVPGC